MDKVNVFRLVILLLSVVSAFVYGFSVRKNRAGLSQIILLVFLTYAVANILFVLFLWINHNTIFHVNLLEGSFLEHVRRAVAGQPIYTKPSADFIPFAYQPLYYYLTVPFVWIFGLSFPTLRLVSILATFGSLVVIFLAIYQRTNSYWWGIMAAGLFAAAYSIFDNNLEQPHPDAWLLFSVLLGCYLVDRDRSLIRNTLGVFFVVLAFWFKQHGAIFAVGVLLYLSWGNNWRKVWPFWLLAFALGPMFYFLIAGRLFGPYYHYFTWNVPSGWTEITFSTFRRFVGFIVKSYPSLSIVSLAGFVSYVLRWRIKENIWYFMLPFAFLSGLLGVLDPGSSNNVFITLGVWFMMAGTLALKEMTEQYTWFKQWGGQLIVFGIAFAIFLYNPSKVIFSPQTGATYQDFISYLNAMDGQVYAPWIGQLPGTDKLYPKANWVALEDIIRGPGVNEQEHPVTKEILSALIQPNGNSYILMNYPLENDPMLGYLTKYYVLDQDLGDRFILMRPINPARWDLMWPRYLYKYKGSE